MLCRSWCKRASVVLLVLFLVVADYFIQNISYPLFDDIDTLKWAEYFTHPTEEIDEDSVFYINIGKDKQLVYLTDSVQDAETDCVVLDTIGNQSITDRAKLLSLLNILSEGDYRYIFLDVRFEKDHHTEYDSALFARIKSMRDIVIATHRSNRYTIADSTLLCKAAYADYRNTMQTGFTRYEFIQDGQQSVALRMYSRLDNHDIKKRFGIYWDGIRPCYNLCFIPLPTSFAVGTPETNQTEDGTYRTHIGYNELSSDLLRNYEPDEIRMITDGKIIIIGDFDNDIHSTYIGEVPGPMLSLAALRYLSDGNHLIEWWYFPFLAVFYLLLVVSHLKRWTFIDYVRKRMTNTQTGRCRLSWGWLMVLKCMSLTFVLLCLKLALFYFLGKSLLLTLPMIVLWAISIAVDVRTWKHELSMTKQ